jgi:CHAT domain-containing protein
MRTPVGWCNVGFLPRRGSGVKPGISIPGRLISLLWIAAALIAPAAPAAEPPFVPIPSYSPEAEAVREAAALRRKGDQLQERVPAEKVREVWQAAVEAYRRAGYQFGEVELLFRIAASYQSEIMNGPEAVIPMLDAMTQGATITAGYLDGLARLEGAGVPAPDSEVDALLSQGLDLAQVGDCAQALPLLANVGKMHAERGASTGELRALAGRLRCQQTKGDDPMSFMAFMGTLQEFMAIAQGLDGKLKAGPAVRYLRAVERAELGKLEEAETLLQGVLPELDRAGDVAGAGRAALDLGCVLLREGKPEEAEPFLRQARDAFAGLKDPASRRNLSAAEKNLAGLGSPVDRIPEDKLAFDFQPESEPELEMPKRPPEPAGLSARARAWREAAFLMGEGGRLEKAGRLAAAREKWEAAAETYRRGEDLWEVSQVYLRLAESYGSWSVMDEKKLWLSLDYFDRGLAAYAEVSEGAVRKDLSRFQEQLDRADDLLRRAARLTQSGDCGQAAQLLPEARSLYRQVGLVHGEVRSLLSQARCLVQSGEYAEGLGILLELLPMLKALCMESPASELGIEADELFKQGRLQDAKDAYQDLLCRSEKDRDVPRIALALLGLGKVEAALGNPSEAEILLERALGLLPLVDEELDETREVSALEELGGVYFSAGRLEEGSATLQKARQAAQKAGRPGREVASLRRLSMGLIENGEFAAASSALEEAAGLQQFLPRDPEVDAYLAILNSFIGLLQGKFQDALARLFEAQDLYGERGLTQKQAVVTWMLGVIQQLLGRQEGVPTLYEKAGDLGVSSFDAAFSRPEGVGELLVLLQEERFAEAVDLGKELLVKFEESKIGAGRILVRPLLIMSYFGLGKVREARSELDSISRIATEILDGGAATKLETAAATLMKTIAQNLDKALTLLENLQSSVMPVDAPQVSELLDVFAKGFAKDVELLNDSSQPLGDIGEFGLQLLRYLQSGVPQDLHQAAPKSLVEMDKMLALFNRLADGLTVGELKAPFLSQYAGFHSSAVELNWSTGRPEEAFRYAEEARARAFTDQIGNQKIDARRGADPRHLREERRIRLLLNNLRSDLRDEQRKSMAEQNPERLEKLQASLEETEQEWRDLMFRLKVTNPESAMLLSVDSISLEEFRTQVLDGETSLVEYFVSDGVGEGVFAWVVERERFEMVQLPVASGDLRNRVAEIRTLIEARQPVRSQVEDVYRLLFAPLASHVTHRHLVIVPYGVLHFLPFAALWDAERKSYLGDIYTLSYAPSATVLKFALQRQAPPRPPILVAGNPDGSLPNAVKEAQAIARLYRTEPLLGTAATESAIVSRASEAGILHLAAHAELNPINPLFTSIRLAPDGEHDGNLEMHEVYGLDLSKTGLVVLSACKTQMGKLSRGDEIEGLTRAFLYAGTPAVMSSLWDVDDESTAFFMERFYTHLRKGEGRAEALRLAQRDTRRRFPHPYHWASFVLTGDGR